jgi:uncharacterized protein (TIGR02001 family)
MADVPPPVAAIEFNLSSQGISKGLAQTRGPQVLARGELNFGAVYLGGYAKNVDSATSDGEVAALVGLRGKLAGFNMSVSAALKNAVHAAHGSDAHAIEVQASIVRSLGPITPHLALAWSPDELGSTRCSLFAEAGAAFRLTKTLSGSAAVGHRTRTGGADYTAWNAGMAWTAARPLTIDLRYYDSEGGDSFAYRPRLVLSGRWRF